MNSHRGRSTASVFSAEKNKLHESQCVDLRGMMKGYLRPSHRTVGVYQTKKLGTTLLLENIPGLIKKQTKTQQQKKPTQYTQCNKNSEHN